MTHFKNLNDFIIDNTSFLPSSHPFLMACSSGVDSMVLVDILIKKKIPFSIAHCNFNLRGKESLEDQSFLSCFSLEKDIKFHTKNFDTTTYAKKNGLSIQMAARELRYEWFLSLIKQYTYDGIILAHHLDDSIETFFINLLRGTGIKGLCGIPATKQKIIRPLIDFTKEDILNYAREHKLIWREDSSNKEDKYIRNAIRHHLIPSLKDIKEDFYKRFKKTFNYLSYEYALINKNIEEISSQITLEKESEPFFWKINTLELRDLNPLELYLYKIFAPYGFKNVADLIKMLDASSGKKLFSSLYTLIKYKDHWIISKKESNEIKEENKLYPILKENTSISNPIAMQLSLLSYKDSLASLWVDFNQIKWPIYIRKWNKKDYFYPLGMKHRKKLVKYFKDEHLNFMERDKIWVLTTLDDKIIWVIGKRLDDRFKISEKTKNILNIYI